MSFDGCGAIHSIAHWLEEFGQVLLQASRRKCGLGTGCHKHATALEDVGKATSLCVCNIFGHHTLLGTDLHKHALQGAELHIVHKLAGRQCTACEVGDSDADRDGTVGASNCDRYRQRRGICGCVPAGTQELLIKIGQASGGCRPEKMSHVCG